MLVRSKARVAAAAGTALAAAATATILAAPASAVAGNEIDYNTTGSTTLTNPNSRVTVDFKPTVLQSFVNFDANGAAVKAYLPLAPVQAGFKAYGFLPAKGTVVFTQVGQATGRLGNGTDQGYPLNVTAKYVVSLRNVTIGGADAGVGTNCQTAFPVVVKVTSEPGFNLSDGVLDGTYDLGKFINCGQGQQIINDTLPGTGNTLNLAIHFASPSSAAQSATLAQARAGAAAS